MKNLALLDYTFLFDPSELWTNTSQFEGALYKFFEERGIDCQTVTTNQSNNGRRMIVLSQKPMVKTSEKVTTKGK